MRRLLALYGIPLFAVLLIGHIGCPSPGESSIALIVTPTSLDFGATKTEMVVQVSKNYTNKPMAPFRATASEPWISVEPDGGTSSGPQDPVTITVTVDRQLLGAGTNSGSVRISSEGASDRYVQVTVFRQVTANFTVEEVQPFEGDPVAFRDISQVSGSSGSITGWLWEFGDGVTSEEQHPSHVYESAGTFDVTLTVTADGESATLTKQNYITVREKIAPLADFYAAETTVPAGSSVGFVDDSDPGTMPISSWEWSFDADDSSGSASGSGPAPAYVYDDPGVYTVRLKVTTAHGTDEEVKRNYITVEPVPPQVDFTCSNVQPLIGTSVDFTDLTEPGHASVASWYWEFGDGDTSTEQNPAHMYDTQGTFTVSLTVTDTEGNQATETKTGYITVQGFPPEASFEVDRSWGVTLDTFAFTNTSDDGTGEAMYLWEFGDGASSTEENPTHAYEAAGDYTVTLLVSNAYGSDTAQVEGLPVYEATALDRYVRKDDGVDPAVSLTSSQDFEGGQWDVLTFTSQQWREAAEVTPHLWEHWLALAIPDVIKNDTALLFISGGDMDELPPERVDELTDFAVKSGSVVALLKMVPNQPTVFAEEGQEREEDALIAYTFDQYLDGAADGAPDEEWPALLPMTKAAVRAMDVVQEYAGALPRALTVEDFVVTGASKRGWTTWLTAAADHRVVAIAPMVIDLLNLDDQMTWHESALCGYAEAIHDYVDMDVIGRLGTPEGDALQEIVDPYAYTKRFTIPKLGLNGTADQFFLPDSAQFYYPAISRYGSMHLRYFPNGDHWLLDGYDATVRGMLPFYSAVVNNQTLPSLEWEITDAADEATLEVQLDTVPLSATLWTGTVPPGPNGERDFRIESVGDQVWQATELSPATDDGLYYVAPVSAPVDGWTGYFMSFEFSSGIPGEPHIFTTEVRCTPSITPCYQPGGYGDIETVGSGSDAVTVVRLGGNRFEMGYWYGYLLADQISAIWAMFAAVAASQFPPGTLDNAVSQMWKDEYFDTAAWEEELSGIAHGCRMAGYPDLTVDVLKKIQMIPDVSEFGCCLFAAWGDATAGGEMYQLRNLDWSMDLGAQDYPVVAIYEPTDGIKHAVIGFAGLIGIAGGGMNDYGIAVSEIMGYFCDDEYLEGIPFPVLLRDILYHDSTLAQALTRMETATRTNQYHYCIGAPNATDPKARLLFTSRTRFDEWVDNESVAGQHPCHPDVNPFHAPLNDAVYWKNHNGRDNEIVYNALSNRYGTLNGQGAIEVARAAGVNSTVLSIVYHNSGGRFWVAYADGPTDPAHNQNYVEIKLNP